MREFSKNSGFTFVETILTIIIVGLIAGVAAKVLISGLDVYSLIVNRNSAFHTARAAMERIQDELLYVKTADITWMADTRFGFRDLSGVSTSFRRTTVIRSGRVIPCINRGNDYLAGDVTQLDFDYYKADGSSAFWFADLRRINIEISVLGAGSSGTVHLRSDVYPRNFMYTNFH